MAGEGSLDGLSFWRVSLMVGTMVWGVLVLRAGFCMRVGIEDIMLSFRTGTTCSLFREISQGVVTLVGDVSGVVVEFEAFSDPSISPPSAGMFVW